MSYSSEINELLNSSLELRKACSSTMLAMRQHSDALSANIFDHIAFIGTETTEEK